MSIGFNWSTKQTLGFLPSFRKRNGNRHIIGPHLKKIMINSDHRVDAFFEVERMNFICTKKGNEKTVLASVVYCKVLISFLSFIKNERQINNVYIKIGVDGGGYFLKICLSVQNLDDDSFPESSKIDTT